MDETNRWKQLHNESSLQNKTSFNTTTAATSSASSTPESDKIRAKAQAMISARLNRSRSNLQLRDEVGRVDKYYQAIVDQIQQIDDQLNFYQQDMNYFLKSDHLTSTTKMDYRTGSDEIKQRQMFEKGLYVGDELAKFIDTLPLSTSNQQKEKQSTTISPAVNRRTSYRRSLLDPLSPIQFDFDIPPPIPTTDRPDSPRSSADIKAEARRRIEQRKKIILAKQQQPSLDLLKNHSSSSPSLSLMNTNKNGSASPSPLLHEKENNITEDEKIAQEKLRQAEMEARERLAKMREKRDIARQETAAAEEKRKKAAEEAARIAEEEMQEEKRRKEQEEQERMALEKKQAEALAERQRQLDAIAKQEQERKDAERIEKEKLEEEARQRKARMAAQKAAMEKRRLRQEQEAREKEEELIRLEELKRKEEWEKSEMEKRRQEQLKDDQEKLKQSALSVTTASSSSLSRSPSPSPHQDLSTSTTTTTTTTETSPTSMSINDDHTATAGTSGYGVDMDDEVDFATIYRVKALYVYQGIREDDLSFVEDEIIKAHPSKDKNSDWWYGTSLSTNAVGFFPRTYVEIIEKAFRVQALYEFEKTRFDDLGFNENDILVVQPFQDENGDWWYGTNEETGEAGYFPKTYVQPLETGASTIPDITIEPSVISPSKSNSSWKNTISASSSSLLIAPEDDSIARGISAPTTPVLKKNVLDVNKQDINRRRRAASNASTISTSVVSTPSLQLPQQQTVQVSRPESPSVLSWTSSMDDIELQSIPLEERQRQEAIFELITTERSYLRDLQMIVNLFYAESGKYLKQNEQEVVFSNIEDLLICNTTFLSDLETRQRECANVIDCVGDIFLQHAESLKCYSTYCRNQSFASRFLQKKREEDQWFEVFLKTAQTRSECRSLDLAHFLLEPVQRITRYPLLLKQILKSTPKRHPDYGLLKSALTNASTILDDVNEETRRFENQQKMSELSRILDMEGFGRLDIRGREFIMDGVLYKAKSGRKLHGYLFNDMFLLVEPLKSLSSKGYLYTLYREPMNIGRITIREQQQIGLINSFGNNTPDDTSFQIVYGNIVISVRTANVSMKRQWINQIQHYSAIKALY
ncbi:unnamed protein product [Cunninghamella echinulata]